MTLRIDADRARFDAKLRRLKKAGLTKYLQNEPLMVPRPDKDNLRIPIPRIIIPQFRFRDEDIGGIGQGDGEEGSIILDPTKKNQRPMIKGQEKDDEDEILGGHWNREQDVPADHEYAEFTKQEIADIIGEQLRLPNLRDIFGGGKMESTQRRYSSIRRVGPNSLRHFRRTYREALRRSIASGTYDPRNPVVVPIKEDSRFRAPKDVISQTNNAVIIFVLDCSGSMLRTLDFLQEVAWWADTWIQKHYQRTVRRYVHYDHAARESTAEDFYRIEAGGENNMGVALSLAHRIFLEYPKEQYNRYLVHLTDGDYAGLNVTQGHLESYRGYMERYRDYYRDDEDKIEIVVGNPLIDLILPNCNAVFVCEAGAYYDRGGDPSTTWGSSNENYSQLLGRLTEEVPSSRKKLRFVSYDEQEIEDEGRRKIPETLTNWFS